MGWQKILGLRRASGAHCTSLPLYVAEKKMDKWCWAAVAVGVARFLGGSKETQCQAATRVLNAAPNYCCPTNGACDSERKLSLALGSCYRDHDRGPGPRNLGFVERQLSYGLPVPVRMASGADGHFVVISGCSVKGNEEWLDIWDPDYRAGPIPVLVQTLLTNYKSGGSWKWETTYRTKK